MESNHLLRAAREARPSPSAPGESLSRAELAEAVTAYLWRTTGKRYALDAHTIARYERGVVRWPSAPYRAGLRAALNADSDEGLGFRRPQRRARAAAKPQEFSTEATNTEHAVSAPCQHVETEDVNAIRHMLDALTVSDRRFGGGDMREQATAYFSSVVQPRLQARSDERTRRELLSCATEFALRVASMELDSGRVAQSRNLVAMATRFAHETDDLALEAWALARRGELEMYEAVLADHHGLRARWQSGVHRAVACTGAARSLVAGGSPMARAFVVSKYALAVSMTGDRAEAERLIAQVWRDYEQVEAANEHSWTRTYGWHHLRHDESRCYANLGLGRPAVHAALEGVNARSDARPRALSIGIVALGRIRAGDLDGASEAGRELVALTERTSSHRTRLRLREVVAAFGPHRVRGEIRELCEEARPILHEAAHG